MISRSIPFCLPGSLSPEVFLNDYWGKKPLLIKNGLPALANLFDPDDILELALEDEVQARLITQSPSNKGDNWQVKKSPLTQKDFKALPKHWTVLIQNLEQWSHELGQLWQAFDFIPKWQQDDIMVSYAPDGGSVGRHFDEYDVFLAQGYGSRRWQLGDWCDENTQFVAGQPIRLLDDMGQIVFDEVLEAGDVLYVPPRLSHYGVAVGECLTFSFGFRRPSMVQILDKLADVATTDKALFAPLALPQAHQDPYQLSPQSLDALKHSLIQALTTGQLDKVFTQAVSELVSTRQYPALSFFDEFDGASLKEVLNDGATLALNPASRFVKHGNIWYINGEQVCFDDASLELLTQFIQGKTLTHQDLKDDNQDTLADWVNQNWLSIVD